MKTCLREEIDALYRTEKNKVRINFIIWKNNSKKKERLHVLKYSCNAVYVCVRECAGMCACAGVRVQAIPVVSAIFTINTNVANLAIIASVIAIVFTINIAASSTPYIYR
uniref:Uncharacterized protein n=1 Tax=Glossina brevipalpis TaxID=37001 RepID=A0A1A9W8M2_9MUSC